MATDKVNGAVGPDGAEGASGALRMTAPADQQRTARLPFPVVGIGASAGGLEAYIEFLQACPANAGIAFVLVQHLPPDRESMLTEILAKHTRMKVVEVTDGAGVERDHVYVIRPGHTLTIKNGCLHLGTELAARGHGRPVDDFFRSLAEEQQHRAIAVVFSGMGSNGTAGAEVVKAVGGLVIAQEPDSAKFPAMPRGLIDSHLPDFILRPSEVPEVLVRYAGQPYASAEEAETTPRDEQTLSEVLGVLRTRTRHDFSGYRKPTLLRRIQRRMSLASIEVMAEYVRILRQTPAEVTALADDLLIHVTGFFRDPDAWHAIREKVIAPLVADRQDGAEVRCWVAACATGEEAYTLAMLLVEAAEACNKRFDIKIFATDMAERALGAARAGVFPNGIESEVTPERLARFFDKDDSFYRIQKDLRELVVFAPQNLLQDPPFSRLDIATCRNLLIYLEPDTQRRVLALLHFGLRHGGALMLGSSETATMNDGGFEPIDKRHRIFRRVGPSRPGTLELPALAPMSRPKALPMPQPVRPGGVAAAQLVTRALLDTYTPAAVAVDAAGQILHVHGDTSRFLMLPTGTPTLDLMAMANDHVRGAVRTALHRATEARVPVTVRDGFLDTPEGRRRVEIGVTPLGPQEGPPLYLVTFLDYPEPAPPPPLDDTPAVAERLAEELQRTRDELQGTLEEMQSSNEELKASHEEATSLNEELQSTNEELETSKEEMQSLNEELVTVNAQLQAKMSELEATANDMGSLLTSTDIAVLFLDPKFRIRRYTPAVKDLLDLIPSDVGRPLVDLRRKFADPELLADAQAVLDRLIPIERSIESESGRAYLRRVLPYRTQDNRIDGVVVAFVDMTERRIIEDALRASESRLRALVRASANAVYRMSPDWRQMLNLEGVGFLTNTTQPSESWLDRYILPSDRPAVLAAINLAIRDKIPFELEHQVIREDGSIGWTLSRAVPLLDAQGEIMEWFGAASEVTARRQAQEAVRQSEEKYRTLFESMDEGFCIIEVLFEADRAVDYRFLETNPAFERLTGITNGIGRRVLEFAPSQEKQWFDIYGRVAEIGEPVRFQHGTSTLDRYYDVYAFRIGNPEQRRVAVLFTDITDRKRREVNLAFLAETSQDLVRLTNMDAIMDALGAKIGAHFGAAHCVFSVVDDEAGTMSTSHAWNRAGVPSAPSKYRISDYHTEEFQRACRAGETYVVRNTATDVRMKTANVASLQAGALVSVPLVRDSEWRFNLSITDSAPRDWREDEIELMRELTVRIWTRLERARTEAALQASEERFRAAVDLVPDLMWESRADGYTDWYNRRWLEYTGQTFEQATGWGWIDVIHPDDHKSSAAIYARGLEAGESVRHEHRIRRADGAYRWFLIHAVPVQTPAGEARWYGAATDIHDERDVRDLLEQRVAERTAELEAEMARRRELTRLLSTAQEDERQRVARDLHDTVGQLMAGLSLAFKAIETSGDLPAPTVTKLVDAQRVMSDLGKEVHGLATRLRPTALDDLGLEPALTQLVAEWSSRTAVQAQFHASGLGRLPPDVETTIYRIVQEALTNIAKHAQANIVSVVVTRPDGFVSVVIEDDGTGFDLEAAAKGRLGLRGIRERVELVGGDLDIESNPGMGTTISVRIPSSHRKDAGQ